MGKLKNSVPSRIVNVSALLAKKHTNLDVNDLNKHPEGRSVVAEITQYANSKLCNLLFTRELAKKLDGTGVTTNSLHPGVINTHLLSTAPSFLQHLANIVGKLLFINLEEGAQTIIYVALAKELEGVTGELFDNCRQVEMYDVAKDASLGKNVWKQSEDFVKLRNDEKL